MEKPSNRVFSVDTAFKHFPRRLIIAREVRNVYANSLALMAGLTQATVSNYETGKNRPTAENFFKLCKVLRTHPNFMCGLSDQIEFKNYSVMIEEQMMNMSANDQKFIYKFICDFKAHYYEKEIYGGELVVPFPGAHPPF